jgi:hypothetical protein
MQFTQRNKPFELLAKRQIAIWVKTVKTHVVQDRRLCVQSLQTGSPVGA